MKIIWKIAYLRRTNNSITYNNGFADLEIKMDENFNLKAKNTS